MADWPGVESGTSGRVLSLAGVPGSYRRTRGGTGVSVTSTAETLLPNNPKRVLAFILNLDVNNTVRIGLGASPGATNAMSVTLDPGAYFQIDAFLPWTGAVWVYSASGATIDWGEEEVFS